MGQSSSSSSSSSSSAKPQKVDNTAKRRACTTALFNRVTSQSHQNDSLSDSDTSSLSSPALSHTQSFTADEADEANEANAVSSVVPRLSLDGLVDMDGRDVNDSTREVNRVVGDGVLHGNDVHSGAYVDGEADGEAEIPMCSSMKTPRTLHLLEKNARRGQGETVAAGRNGGEDENDRGSADANAAMRVSNATETCARLESELIMATELGLLQVVHALLDSGIDVNSQRVEATPLYIACQNSHVAIVKFLLKRGARVDLGRSDGTTPLTAASQFGSVGCVRLLIQHGAQVAVCARQDEVVSVLLDECADIDVELRDNEGASVLFFAAQNGLTGCVEALLGCGADVNGSGSALGDTPLTICCQEGRTEVLSILLERDEIDVNKARQIDSASPLFLACLGGHPEIVKVLLRADADIDACTATGETPLMVSAQHGFRELVTLLLHEGAQVNACTHRGVNTLLIACQLGDSEIVRLLLDGGAGTDDAAHDSFPLWVASSNGHIDVVNILLEFGALVDQRTSIQGSTCLMTAAQNGHGHVVSALVHANATVDLKMSDGVSALLLAVQNGHRQCVKVLIEAGAIVNRFDQYGVSPLIRAALHGHTQIASDLLRYGADVNHAVFDGDSALSVAIEDNNTDLVRALIDAGADVSMGSNAIVSPTELIDKLDENNPMRLAFQVAVACRHAALCDILYSHFPAQHRRILIDTIVAYM